MATTKLGSSKNAGSSLNYAEKRATEHSGLNCDPNYARSAFKSVRMAYGKDNGVQAHTIIQSFKPGEVSAKKANQIGFALAQQIAPGHQVAIYTHTDKDHYHNHIIINSVNLETGKKYQSNAKQRHFVKNENDRLCLEHGLSVPEKGTNPLSYTLAEKELLQKGKTSWKDELRQAIDLTKKQTKTVDDLAKKLEDDFQIEMKIRGKTVSYKHPDKQRFVRAKKLGNDYELGGLQYEFIRQVEEERHKQRFDEHQRELQRREIAENRRTEQTDIDRSPSPRSTPERDESFQRDDFEIEF